MSTQQSTLYHNKVVSDHGETKAKPIYFFVFRRTERPGHILPYMAKSVTATDRVRVEKLRHQDTIQHMDLSKQIKVRYMNHKINGIL